VRAGIDDAGLQCPGGGQARCLANSLLGPIGVAAAQFSEAADEGDGIVALAVVAFFNTGAVGSFFLVAITFARQTG